MNALQLVSHKVNATEPGGAVTGALLLPAQSPPLNATDPIREMSAQITFASLKRSRRPDIAAVKE